MKVPNLGVDGHRWGISLSRLQNEGSQPVIETVAGGIKSIKATE